MNSLLFNFMLPVFLSFTGLSHGEGVVPDNLLNETLGGSVIFNTTFDRQFALLDWSFINDENVETTIISSTPTAAVVTGSGYKDRINLNTSLPVSLELRNLNLNDSGKYKVIFKIDGGEREEGSTYMVIYTPVSNVVVTPNTADYVEFNGTAVLRCSVSSGSDLSYLWLNGSSEVTSSERVQIGDGGSNLTIVNVTRNDQGPFSCRVFNPISNETSDPVELNINFGPENTKVSPSKVYYEEGSELTLSCIAVSEPAAVCYWFLNGTFLNGTFLAIGTELIIMNIQIDQSGNYSCQAFNNKTLRYHMSEESVVTVLEKISGAAITASTVQPVEGNSINLTCDAAGSIPTREWMKDNQPLTPSSNVTLYDNNRVLSFSALKKTDSGEYLCRVRNPINFDEATYNMKVNQKGTVQPFEGLSGGAIAAIVIVVLLVIGGTFGGGGYYLYKKGTFRSNGSTSGSDAGHDNRAGPEEQEVNYADVRQFRRKDGGSVPLGNLGTSPTEYAEVRTRTGGGTSSPPTYDAHMHNVKRSDPQPGQLAGPQPVPRAASQAAGAGQPADGDSSVYSQVRK